MEDELILRRSTVADLPAIHDQWVEAQWVGREDTTVAAELERFDGWVAELDGAVVAGVLSVPFEQRVGGTDFTMAGIRGVTCALNMRRRGIVDRLFRHALHELRASRDVSTLYPFSPPFYEKYGYGICGHVIRWRLLLDDLDLPQPPRPPRCLTREDIPALIQLAERELPQVGNGAVHLGEYWFDRYYFPRTEKDAEPITMGWFDAAGELEAAICFKPQRGGGIWDKNRLFVRNVHAIDNDHRREALGFLRTLSDQYLELVIDLPAGDLFYHAIRKPYRWDSTILREDRLERSTNYEVEWQARLLDPARALSRPRRLHGPGSEVLVQLRDPVFADLNGTFRWRVSATDPGWEPLTPEAASAGLPRIELGVGDLSRIWYGAVGVHQLRRVGRVVCDDEVADMLHAALGGFRNHLQIHF